MTDITIPVRTGACAHIDMAERLDAKGETGYRIVVVGTSDKRQDVIEHAIKALHDAIPTDPHAAEDPILLKWETFKRHQMGRGVVAFSLSEQEKKDGAYDPHCMFEHVDAMKDDDFNLIQVERDCQDLMRLLNKFRIEPKFVTDIVKRCAIAE